MPHPLDGVQAKIDRALEHINALQSETTAFVQSEPSPYDTVTGEPDKDGWRNGRFLIEREPPPKLGVIAGDITHNLRSALDHLVFQLAGLTKKAPSGGTAFPIFRSESDYLSPGECDRPSPRDRLLNGLTNDHRTLIDAEQPYQWRDPTRIAAHPLVHLSRFGNIDKHRIIHPAYGRAKGVRAYPIEGECRIELVTPKERPELTHGADIYRVRFSPLPTTDSEVRVKIEVSFWIVFGKYRLSDADFLTIHSHVIGIVDRFRPIFD